jgi:hypothetical protein
MDKIIELFKVSGFAAVLTTLITVGINSFVNQKIDRRREQQQFIRQILPERMKAHSAIMRVLINTSEKIRHLLVEPPEARLNKLMKCTGKLHTVYVRNMLWIDKGVSDLFGAIYNKCVTITLVEKGKLVLKETLTNEECLDLLTEFAKYQGYIQNRIRSRSGIPLLDKTLSEMSIKSKNARKSSHRS